MFAHTCSWFKHRTYLYKWCPHTSGKPCIRNTAQCTILQQMPQFNYNSTLKEEKINKFIQLFMQQHTQKHQSVTMLRLGRYILITVRYLLGFHQPILTSLHTQLFKNDHILVLKEYLIRNGTFCSLYNHLPCHTKCLLGHHPRH